MFESWKDPCARRASESNPDRIFVRRTRLTSASIFSLQALVLSPRTRLAIYKPLPNDQVRLSAENSDFSVLFTTCCCYGWYGERRRPLGAAPFCISAELLLNFVIYLIFLFIKFIYLLYSYCIFTFTKI